MDFVITPAPLFSNVYPDMKTVTLRLLTLAMFPVAAIALAGMVALAAAFFCSLILAGASAVILASPILFAAWLATEAGII